MSGYLRDSFADTGTSASVDDWLASDTKSKSLENVMEVSSSAIPVFDSGRPCGEVIVDAPETQTDKTGLKKFTSFNVHGTLNQMLFASRKRYSDFHWLRTALLKQFPGVFLPALPGKQIGGRFDDSFIEERRVGLELFLRRLFQRQEICIRFPLVINFLTTGPADLDRLRAETDARTIAELHQNYETVFGETLAEHNAPKSDKGFLMVKAFLEKHVPILNQALIAALAVQKQEAVLQSKKIDVGKALKQLSEESEFLEAASASESQLRNHILSRLHQSIETEEAGKASATLCASLQREMEDCESVNEALASIENLQRQLLVAKGRVQQETASLSALKGETIEVDENLSQGSPTDALASGTRKRDKTMQFFGKLTSAVQDMGAKAGLNKENRIRGLDESIARDTQEIQVLETHIDAARTVFSATEITAWLETKVQGCAWTQSKYATQKAEIAQELGALWASPFG